MALLRHLRRLKMRIKNVLFNNMQQFCLSKLGFYNNLLYDQTYGKKPETFRKKQTLKQNIDYIVTLLIIIS